MGGAAIAAIAVGVILTMATAYVVGRVVGAGGDTPTLAPGSNNMDPAACAEACGQWVVRRAEKCNIEKDEATAKTRVDDLRAQFLALGAAAAALATAAALVANIPYVGIYAAIALLAAAGTILLYATYIQGVLGAAEIDFAAKSKAAQAARTAETVALSLMVQKCSPDEVAKCLALPSPC